MAADQKSLRQDRWLILPLVLAVALPLAMELLDSFGPVTLRLAGEISDMELLLAAISICCSLSITAFGVINAWRCLWRASVSCFVLPAVLAALILFPSLRNSLTMIADYTHFYLLSPAYLEALDRPAAVMKPKLDWFFWGRSPIPLDGETLTYLVYDESDEFDLPDPQRTVDWRRRAEASFSAVSGYADGAPMPEYTHHLFGHYYVVRVYIGAN